MSTHSTARHLSLVPTPESGRAEASDAELVVAMRAGDVRAEERLFKRHAVVVHRLARRMLRSDHDADDVVQDTFTKAHEQLASLRDPTLYRAWLMRTAVSLVHRRFRRRKLLATLGFVDMPDGAGLADVMLPTLSAETRLDIIRIDAALARAPADERIAWTLRHVDGLALDEVAVACGTSLATVKRKIAKAQAIVSAHSGYDGGADE